MTSTATPTAMPILRVKRAMRIISGGRFRGAAADLFGDLADLGLEAGGGDQTMGAAAGHDRAGKADVVAGGERRAGRGAFVGAFLHRRGFAGQQRLVALQIDGLGQADIGGHPVARLEQHQIARHQIARRDAAARAIADHHGMGLLERFEGVGGAAGRIFLGRADDAIDQQHRGDEQRILEIAQGQRDDRRRQQDVDQRVEELAQEHPRQRGRAALRQRIGAIGDQALAGLRLAQAGKFPGRVHLHGGGRIGRGG